MLTTVAPLGIALRNARTHSKSFERNWIFTKNDDLSGDNVTLRSLRSILVLNAPYRLTVDAENTIWNTNYY